MVLSIGFIGSGKMASALMDALILRKITKSSFINCSDISQQALHTASQKGYTTYESNINLCQQTKDAIILSVKPHIIPTICQEINPYIDNNIPIISIAAGISLSQLESYLPKKKLIRVMPNTPCQVCQAASCYSLGTNTEENDQSLVEYIFSSVGLILQVSEYNLDAVTGLSGSGPAYVYEFIQALSDGGVRCGLPRDVSIKLSAQTVKGAADMVLHSNHNTTVLRENVTSPGGTTSCGLDKLEEGKFRSIIVSAVKESCKRSMQLSGKCSEEIMKEKNL